MGMGTNNRNSPPTEWGIIGPAIGIFFAVLIFGFWPVLIMHGQTDTGGWRWDIHSTFAEAAYLGCVAFSGVLIWAGNRKPRPVMPKAITELRPPPPSVCVPAPLCLHLGAVKVDSVTDRSVVYRCWCPDCEAELPANWRRLCCATEPGAAHVYNCPQGLREMTS